MKTNVLTRPETHEGAKAAIINAEQQLRRSVMSCLLWEREFYEEGVEIAQRITSLVAACKPDAVARIAIEARSKMHLRHVPLLLCRELAKLGKLKAETLASVIQRADELTEFLSLYSLGREGTKQLSKLSNQVKKGLGSALGKFNEYSLAKYNREGKVKLRDVLFLCHPKPANPEQEALWKRLAANTLATPDTWEVELSASKDKKASWERLLSENKLGAMALLRNLRNMNGVSVPDTLIRKALSDCKPDRVLPFRFIAAARAVPALEDAIEPVMLRCLEVQEKLPGKTAIVVDNSGSMSGDKVSAKSDMDRSDAACALAILVREICELCVIIGFGTEAAIVPPRRGFALADAIKRGPGGGTYTAVALALAAREGYDRIIVITDEQSHEAVGPPVVGTKGYFVNVASAKNGIGYGAWNHIDGWSEAIISYIRQVEGIGESLGEHVSD